MDKELEEFWNTWFNYMLNLGRHYLETVKYIGKLTESFERISSDFENRITRLEDEIDFLRSELEEVKDLAEW